MYPKSSWSCGVHFEKYIKLLERWQPAHITLRTTALAPASGSKRNFPRIAYKRKTMSEFPRSPALLALWPFGPWPLALWPFGASLPWHQIDAWAVLQKRFLPFRRGQSWKLESPHFQGLHCSVESRSRETSCCCLTSVRMTRLRGRSGQWELRPDPPRCSKARSKGGNSGKEIRQGLTEVQEARKRWKTGTTQVQRPGWDRAQKVVKFL